MSSNRKLCLFLRSPLFLQLFNWDARSFNVIGCCFALVLHATTKVVFYPITEVYSHLISNRSCLTIDQPDAALSLSSKKYQQSIQECYGRIYGR